MAYVDVPVNGDTTVEPNEAFTLNLSAPTKGGVVSDKAGAGLIVNDDGTPGVAAKPKIYVDDLWTEEGDSGTHAAVFHVRLDKAMTTKVTVKVATGSPTTGAATAGTDYDAVATKTITFDPGVMSLNVPVTIHGDLNHEITESLLLKLSSASTNATIADTSGEARIFDEEGPIAAYVSDVLGGEGSAASPGQLAFTISLGSTPGPGEQITVGYSTASSTAKSGTDFVAKTGTVTLDAANPTAVVTVDLIGDDTFEANKSMTLSLKTITPKGNVLGDTGGTGVIINDD